MNIQTLSGNDWQRQTDFPGDCGTSTRWYAFQAGQLTPAEPETADVPVRLTAADSWLVDNGYVRALDRHRSRFAAACREADAAWATPDRLDAFWAAVLAQLPRWGRWFPRVELVGGGAPQLCLLLRPAPSAATRIRLWLGDPRDRRRTPRRKGPDLDILARMRARAVAAGADEGLITTSQGIVLEGATTSLLWWEDGRLCLPSPSLRLLPGITSRLLVARAHQLGVPVSYRRARAAELADREIWAVNALHGLRPAVNWPGGTLQVGPGHQAPGWQRWLNEAGVPLPG